jgi:hypothetical protein
MVVGKLAAQTPSFFNVLSSIFEATINGGAHWYHISCNQLNKTQELIEMFINTSKQDVSPGFMS